MRIPLTTLQSLLHPRTACIAIVVAAGMVGSVLGVHHRISTLSRLAAEYATPTPRSGTVIVPGVDIERALEGLFDVSPMLQQVGEEARAVRVSSSRIW